MDVISPAPQVFQDLVGLCRDADVLIGPPFQIACRMAHEVLAVPFVSVLNCDSSTLRSKAFRETSAAIVKTVSTPRYREVAARIGERIRAEQGVQTACQLIDQLVGA